VVAAIEETLTIAPPAAEHRSDDVDAHQPGERAGIEIGDRDLAAADARVVDQRDGRAEALVDLGEHPLDVALVGDVALNRGGSPAGRGDLGDDGIGGVAPLAVVDGDGIAPFGGKPRRRRADPARAAGDEQNTGHVLILLVAAPPSGSPGGHRAHRLDRLVDARAVDIEMRDGAQPAALAGADANPVSEEPA
jgi:hypothetical protein